jgi:hypothetical protein
MLERIGVDVANRRQGTSLVAENMRRGSVTGRPRDRRRHPFDVLHHRHERIVRFDRAVAVGRRGDRGDAAVLVNADGAAPRDLYDPVLIGGVGEGVDVTQIVGMRPGRDVAVDDHARDEHRRDGIETPVAIVMQPEPAQVVITREQLVISPPDLHLEVAKAVERIGAAAGGNAAAVLRPRARVLDVPELSVGRRHARHRVKLCNRYRGRNRGRQHASQNAHAGNILRG